MAKFEIFSSSQFKKDLKKFQNKKKQKQAIVEVLKLMSENGHKSIPEKMKPHVLTGQYKGFWECHVMPDLLIIWDEETVPVREISLTRVGTHSELFK